MLPNPEWEPVGEQTARVLIHKTSGRLFWNARVHQYIGRPESVRLEFDDTLQWVGILSGNDFTVIEDEDGNYYIEAKDVLGECGLVFPLENNLTFDPDPPVNSSNRVIVELGGS